MRVRAPRKEFEVASGVSGIKVTVVEGETVDGEKEYFFDSSVRYVVVGRDPVACQVVVPEATLEDGVGAEHIGFRRSLGRYQVDLNTELYVEIDGQRPIEDMELGKVHEIKLGKRLRLRVEVIDTRPAPKRVGGKLLQSADLSRRNQRLVMAGFVLVAGVAAMVAFTQLRLNEVRTTAVESKRSIEGVTQNIDNLSQSLDFLNEQVDTIPTDVLDRVSRSVYLVVKADRFGGEQAQGTAWVTEGGLLATNAHVADAFNQMKSGESLWVRASVAPHISHKITSVDLHPGFKRFMKLWNEYLPVQRRGGQMDLMRTATPADVALLTVEEPERLQPKLDLASRAELEELRPGIRVAFAGYPSEMLLPGAIKQPTPVVQQDEIIRLTNFFMINESEGNRLIHHGLPITGGASGSPIIDASGKVIGLISSGNFVFAGGRRTVNAADVNFGQRLDFLHSMLEDPKGKGAAKYETEWRAQFAKFESAPTVSDNAFRSVLASVAGRAAPETTDVVKATIEFNGEPFAQHNYPVRLPTGGLYLVRLEQPMLGASLRARGTAGEPMTLFAPPLPFTKGLPYVLAFATGTSTLSVDVSVQRGPYIDRDAIETKLSIEQWKVDAASGFVKLLEQSRDFETGSTRKPVYLTRQIDVDQFKFVNNHYVVPTEVEVAKPGYYTFIAIPKKRGVLDGVLLEKGTPVMRDGDSRPLVWIDRRVREPGTKIGFVTTATAPIPQDVYVIHWEKAEESKKSP